MITNDCPFCKEPIKKLTDWYYWDTVNQIIVCKDLHKRKFKYRILIVPYGKKWHREWKEYTAEEKEFISDILMRITMAHIENGATFVKIDTEHFSIRHGHAQVCMN